MDLQELLKVNKTYLSRCTLCGGFFSWYRKLPSDFMYNKGSRLAYMRTYVKENIVMILAYVRK